MFEIHATADGTEMLIAQMEDDYLLRMIIKYCNRIQAARMVLESKVSQDVLLSAIRNQYSLEGAKKRAHWEIRNTDARLKDYVVEAALRGIDVSAHLQKAYKREKAMGNYFNWDMGEDKPLKLESEAES